MVEKEATRLLSYLSKRPVDHAMKVEFVKIINAFFNSDDPISNKFSHNLIESIMSTASNVLNESKIPSKILAEDIVDHASQLLI